LSYREYGVTTGELGASAAQTVMVALLPLLLSDHTTSAMAIGFLVGGEGLFALFIPAWVGHHSDALPEGLARKYGRRTLFLAVGAVLMSAALILTPFVHGYWWLAAISFVFFVALHAYFTPLWTLMLDNVDDERRGRVQGVRSIWRAIGLGYGLIAGGVLFEVWRPLPFVCAAVLVLATTWITTHAANFRRDVDEDPPVETHFFETLRRLHRNRAGFWLLVANALWNAAVDGIRPYFLLFAVTVLHMRVAHASLGLSVLVISLAVGSVVLGRLDGRFSRPTLMQIGTGMGTASMFAGVFMRTELFALFLCIVAGFGMAAVVALGYPLYASVIGDESPAAQTGVFVMSVGIGRIVAPMIVGLAIDAAGYPAMWGMAGILMLCGSLSLWYSRRFQR
jgi:predicted MFS family arabinose efflux permease